MRTSIISLARRLFPLRRVNLLCAVMFLCWCCGQLFLDRTWLTGLMFYIPSPVVVICLAVAAVWNGRGGCPRLAAVATVALLPALLAVVAVENHFWPPDSPLQVTAEFATQPTSTLIHWNVASGRLGWRRIWGRLNQQGADIYILSEPPRPEQVSQWLKELGTDYQAKSLGAILVVAKGRIHDERFLTQTPESHIVSFAWQHNGTNLHVFAVDLISDLDQPRDPLLARLNQLIQEHHPDVVVGDFNAPRRSFRLQNLPTGYRHAYDVAGGELGYTWPVPIPVYALDQCVLGPDLLVQQYDLQTHLSDHRLQRLDFVIQKSSPSEAGH